MAWHNKNLVSIGEALEGFIKENNLQTGIDKIAVKEVWSSLMGEGVNAYTTDVQLKHQTLYVTLSSSVLRQELSYGKSKIVKMLNDELGKELIKSIILR